mgnify:CR=1 FL=1
MAILDNLENSWDENFLFESKPMPVTDSMGRDVFWEDIGREQEEKLTPEQAQAILLFQIEQKLRKHIALQVEHKFHGKYHNESHEIAQFIRNIA